MLKDHDFFYQETASMTKTGGWYIDTMNMTVFWDDQVRKIHQAPPGFQPSFEEGISFFAEKHQALASHSFQKCKEEGVPFDLEMQVVTFFKELVWIRTIGKPVYNENEDIIGVRGVFQDIDEAKLKALKLKESYDLIEAQNEQLHNFAHIVSHNLRSHSSNLEMVIDLLNFVETEEERLAILDNLNKISKNLSDTIMHLNDAVTIKTKLRENLTEVYFEKRSKSVKNSLKNIIKKTHAQVDCDFSQAPTISYLPEYLDSIMLNLISNAIKYKHPERAPHITMKSLKNEGQTCLEVTDNGLGIDLVKNEDKVFGMYKTFHENKDARGVGLFITKNQVEALGGTIDISSKVNEGTTFRIVF